MKLDLIGDKININGLVSQIKCLKTPDFEGSLLIEMTLFYLFPFSDCRENIWGKIKKKYTEEVNSKRKTIER